MVKKNDGFYYMTTNVTIMKRTQKFQPDCDIVQKSVDGRQVKNLFTINGNTLIEKQFGYKNVTIIREFSNDELISTAICGNVTTKGFFRAIDD